MMLQLDSIKYNQERVDCKICVMLSQVSVNSGAFICFNPSHYTCRCTHTPEGIPCIPWGILHDKEHSCDTYLVWAPGEGQARAKGKMQENSVLSIHTRKKRISCYGFFYLINFYLIHVSITCLSLSQGPTQCSSYDMLSVPRQRKAMFYPLSKHW